MMSSAITRLKHWLHEADKLQHMLVSIVLVQMGLYWLDIFSAAAVAFGIGIVKELGDKFFRDGFSWGDIIANAVGVSLGAILVLPWL
ncbi:DUF2279 domain-containing protein [Marinobacter salexigens]|jgi:hypothetical protein|uniref:YfiM family protein n=1 Tax=Marinobacter salexigens TaxID=1925763 RepID=A0ABS6AC51_9GAMM|nr:DUF2279 domain-containing protein [Marinobacter salexigens]MBU2875745.1 YfiM family protein [Marinobacter salexigens]